MNTFVSRIRTLAPAVEEILKSDAGIAIDLGNAGLKGVAVVVLLALRAGYIDPIDISIYLDEHGCEVDEETSGFILEAFSGTDPRYHLWYTDDSRCFHELKDVMEEDLGFVPDDFLFDGIPA